MVRIGNAELKNGIILAPMAGVTDRSFRSFCKRYGAEYMVTEMVSAKAIVYHDSKTPELARFLPEERPIGIQLFGSDPATMAEAASWIIEKYSPENVDINMGCPVKKIVGSGDGSALMLDPIKACCVARAVVRAARGRAGVTVKLRTGYDSSHKNAPELSKMLEDSGVNAVCVHGRTREQLYAPPVDLETIAEVKRSVGIPVIGNGGIACAQDAAKMLEYTGCDAVMIGQGALGNPWIFGEISAALEKRPYTPPDIHEKITVAKENTKLLISDKGRDIGIREARKHLAWYIKGLRGAARLRDRINHTEDEDEIFALLDSLEEDEGLSGV